MVVEKKDYKERENYLQLFYPFIFNDPFFRDLSGI